MSLIRGCGILGMLQIVAGFSVTAGRQPPGNDGTPELIIVQCDYPIWARDFTDRLMPQLKFEPEEFCSIISWTDMNSTPWNLTYRRVESMILGGNNGYNNQLVIKDIEGGYLGRNFKNIGYLQISDLPLKNVTKQLFEGMNRLKHLTFKVKVDFFPLDTFSGLSQLVWFTFEDSMIREISAAHFCLNKQLAFLQLRRNFLKTVNGNLTQNCSGSTINSLDLGGNNFSFLTAGMFKDYNVNGVLQISNCSIISIQREVFIGLENLLDLDISYNFISEIHNGTFSPMNNSIQRIQMSNNFVSIINVEGIFGGLDNIISLDLSSNLVHSIVGTFAILPNLCEINIANNQLKTVHESLFKGLSQLRKLIIANNSLASIDKNAFSGLGVISQLDLSQNMLTQLDPYQFVDLFKLAYINLSNNHITTLNESIFEHNMALEHIILSHNGLSD
ncbi:insulin-like growth factor-binding protein complex acid labile subunit isoform X2 [Dreissena polymorpha]|nr:insulin-like growth factor-binding protein complex acid labile subunit isoform X2 [Dreissena polymorpha]